MIPRDTIDDTQLRSLVERFYERVRADPLLAPVFAAAALDWDDHHARLTDFWSSVMNATGRYKGSIVALHLRHGEAIGADHFERWLALWRAVTAESMPPPAAAGLQAKAAMIAESLQLALHHHRPAA